MPSASPRATTSLRRKLWLLLLASVFSFALVEAGLVDFDRAMRALAGGDPREYFLDFIHPNPKGHAVLAGLLRPWVACAKARTCPARGSMAAGG